MDGTETASCTPDIHSPVKTIIQEVEMKKISIPDGSSGSIRTLTVNLEKASPIEDMDLSGLKPSTPRPYKLKEPTTRNVQPTTPEGKKKKRLLGYHSNKTGHAALKKSFKSVFATVILITGSVKGCLKRSTDLFMANVDLVAQRLDMVVFIVNTAKHFCLQDARNADPARAIP
ncbi:hypothetical protein BGZ47_002068 [Haplosporangium gracile]|nr:hypothetical protein BGZ47_002068 [Haplosporangium gracile]